MAVVLLALLVGGAVPVVAQESTPAAGAGGSGTTVEPLATAALDDLPPAPAFLGLVRFTFPAGAATPPGADPGPILIYVESGTLTGTIEGPATVTRAADAEAEPDAAATPAGAREEEFQSGDSVAIPAETSSSFRNDGQDEATLLAVLVLPQDPFGSVGQLDLNGVGVEVLVGGVLDSIPSPPAVLFLARQTIDAGGGFAPEESLGPVLAYVESGRVTYTVESGESYIIRGRRDATPEAGQPVLAVAPGSETVLGAEDALVEEAGTVSGAQNTDDSPHVHLIVLLGSEEAFAGLGAPAEATPAA
jgi:quercetin dioxygenase-like cupin family protein